MGTNQVIFPRDYAPAHPFSNLDPRIVCGDGNELQAADDEEIVDVDVGAGQVSLALRGFKVMRPPRPAQSKGSQALYLARGADKRDGLLLQYLPAHATTSMHYHAFTRETFHVLAGHAALRTPWGTEGALATRTSVTNEVFVPHQVVTGDSASVILLEMVSPGPGLGMEDHFYPETVLDIDSRTGFPASALSNFAAYEFSVDGVDCASMEGFLQSLKEPDPDAQRDICRLVGFAAKRHGSELSRTRGTAGPLHWRGQPIGRFSRDYQDLLDRAYSQLAKNRAFQTALLATGSALLTHQIGKKTTDATILTETEFCSRLLKIRHLLQQV